MATTSLIAAVPAPTGYVVDFANPQRHGDVAGYWVFGVGLVLSFSFLAMRVYTKVFVARSFAIEDYLWLRKAIGVHVWEIPIERYNFYNIMIMSASVTYVPCLGLSKFSLLLFYHRLSPLRWFKMAVYFLMFVVLGYSFAIIFALIFPCRPVAKNWDARITEGTCINRAAIYTATAAVNIATDIALLTLPIPMIVHLRMPSVQKVGLIFIFAVGSILVEANLVIICGSFPVVRQFLHHVAPGLIGEGSSVQTDRSGSYGLETIGQKASRPKRSRTGMTTIDDIDLDGRYAEHTVEISAEERRDSDGGSETHIVKTEVMTMKYESKV
ncbi:integral membrane protein [Rutstroemia sp. NJR-2017a WRK4]|nr:integral membrane protein [Rutstroemia sp. NJR-2017a WRK4]